MAKIEYACMYCGKFSDNPDSFNWSNCNRSPSKKHILCPPGFDRNQQCACRYCGELVGNLNMLVSRKCPNSPTGHHAAMC